MAAFARHSLSSRQALRQKLPACARPAGSSRGYASHHTKRRNVSGYDSAGRNKRVFSGRSSRMTIAAIRADGDATIGFGHLARSLAMAEALQDMGHDPVLVTRRNNLAHQFITSRSDVRVEEIREDVDEVEKLLSLSAGLVILDVRSTSHKLVSGLKEAGCFIVTFDDLGDGRYLADLVVDANLTSATNPKKMTTTTRYLLGPRYAVIGKQCQKIRSRRRSFGALRRILITCGGSDPAGATPRVVSALSTIDPEIYIDVILGPAFQSGKTLSKAVLESPRHFTIVDSPNDLMRRMKEADLGIISAGISLAEAACLGLPSIVIAQDAIQARNAVPYDESGGVRNLGVAGENAYKGISSAVRELSEPETRRAMSKALTDLVDGKAMGRIKEAIREIIST